MPQRRSWRQLADNWARPIQYTMDLLVLATSLVVAYLLRFEFDITTTESRALLIQLPLVVGLQLAALHLAGVNSFVWRYIGMAELAAFSKAAIASATILVALRLGLPDALSVLRIPLSVILIDTTLAFGGALGLRVVRRWEFERRQALGRPAAGESTRVLLLGAGMAGVAAAREIQRHPECGLMVEGLIDDDPAKQRSRIQGVPVIGTTTDLPEIVEQRGVDQVIVTLGDASPAEVRRIAALCEDSRVPFRVIPDLHEVLGGRVEIRRLRDLAIEDLLGRQQVDLDHESLREFLYQRHVWVTGAGGTIGSELARQALRLEPAKLTLIEHSETALFNVLQEFNADERVSSWIADVRDLQRVNDLMADDRPDVVLHAAAYKHVSLMEDNVRESVRNNALATDTLAQCCLGHEVSAMVLISTDKAVNPTSVMGATKRLAELVVQSHADDGPTRFVAVRFGNVLGSSGSVVPIFRKQIDRGGPVTVTDPRVERYFMTPREAAQLVLQAGAIGESGQILILDMGEPVRIAALAEDMIRLAGLTPHEDIEVVFTGLRKGEKLSEELTFPHELLDDTIHPKIHCGRLDAIDRGTLRRDLEQLKELTESGTTAELRHFLQAILATDPPVDQAVEGGFTRALS